MSPLYYPPQAKKKSPLSAINAWCRHCLGETYDAETHEVFTDGVQPRDCENKFCPLWPYRTGRGPRTTTRHLTTEQKRTVAERLAKGKAAKALRDTVDKGLCGDATCSEGTEWGENLRLI